MQHDHKDRRSALSIKPPASERVDRLFLAVVEDCRRKGPIHSSARIDITAVAAITCGRLFAAFLESMTSQKTSRKKHDASAIGVPVFHR
jgi:hypothetical protein